MGRHHSTPIEDEKKPQSQVLDPPARKPKPFAVQVVDALIDGAAAIAKSIMIEPFARNTKSDKKASAADSSAEETEQVVKRKARNEKSVVKKEAIAKNASSKKANVGGTTAIKRAPAKTDASRLATKKGQRKTVLKKRR
jgi:hypothetical protein